MNANKNWVPVWSFGVCVSFCWFRNPALFAVSVVFHMFQLVQDLFQVSFSGFSSSVGCYPLFSIIDEALKSIDKSKTKNYFWKGKHSKELFGPVPFLRYSQYSHQKTMVYKGSWNTIGKWWWPWKELLLVIVLGRIGRVRILMTFPKNPDLSLEQDWWFQSHPQNRIVGEIPSLGPTWMLRD